MAQLDKPNLVIPLANTYNERGIAGYTNTVTNAIDQRKVNCWYESSVNAATGVATHRIAKRPGTVTVPATLASSLTQHAVYAYAGTSFNTVWVFGKNGSNVVVGDASGNNTIVAANSVIFVDAILISGTNTIIVTLNAGSTYYASVISAWTQIVDADFPTPRGKPIPMDGYLFALDSSNRIWNSNLNDISTWGSTSFITKQIQQDVPVGLMRLGKRIIACGSETMEQFVNVGNATGSPLEVVPSGFQRIGLGTGSSVGANYYAVIGTRLYFYGLSPNATPSAAGSFIRGGSIYAFDGQTLEKVSTPFIDKILNETGVLGISAISILGRTGIAVVSTSVGSDGLVYFPDWKEWFEWTSGLFKFQNSSGGYFINRNGASTNVFNFVMGADTYQDNGSDYTMTVQFKLPTKGNDRNFLRWCGVKGDTARSASTLNVALSRDDYQSFETARGIDMTSSKKSIYRCGSYRDLGVRLTHTGNLDCRLESFLARID